MAQTVKLNEATGAKRRLHFYLVQTDGQSAYTGGAGLQPQISINYGAYSATNCGVLVDLGAGCYYAEVAQAALAAVGIIQGRISGSGFIATPALAALQVTTSDPYAAALAASDVWGYTDRELTAIGAAAVASIWAYTPELATTVADSIGKLIADNVNAQMSTLSTFNPSVTGVKLAANGLDSIPYSDVVGPATNLREAICQVWSRFFRRVRQDATTQTVYKADDATPILSMPVSNVGGVQTRSKGA